MIPFAPMWEQLKRIIKPKGVIVLFGSQPFTSALIMSNPKMFKYCFGWNKVLPRGHLNAKIQPLRVLEDIVVFADGCSTYNPQKTSGHRRKVANTRYEKAADGSQVYGGEKRDTHYDSSERYPTTLLTFSTADQSGKVHPTQKPVALLEYLIKTYTNEGETVLDFTAGSGTMGIAALNTNRNAILIEREPEYCEIIKKRIAEAEQNKANSLFAGE